MDNCYVGDQAGIVCVSGGGVEFMRPQTERVYGIPPEEVVGGSIKTKYEMRDGKPVLVRLPALDFIDDKAGKPVGINSHTGRWPIAAFGNSDGNRQMQEWTQADGGTRLADDAAVDEMWSVVMRNKGQR